MKKKEKERGKTRLSSKRSAMLIMSSVSCVVEWLDMKADGHLLPPAMGSKDNTMCSLSLFGLAIPTSNRGGKLLQHGSLIRLSSFDFFIIRNRVSFDWRYLQKNAKSKTSSAAGLLLGQASASGRHNGITRALLLSFSCHFLGKMSLLWSFMAYSFRSLLQGNGHVRCIVLLFGWNPGGRGT